jgi:hypothetical protein
MSQRAMMVLIFVVAIMLVTVHGHLQIISHYSLMQYTRIVSEEHFSVGRPLVIVTPFAVKESPTEEVGYLIEELHISGRWPIVVYNGSGNINGNMYTERRKHENYIILISGPCGEWTEYISRFQQQLYALSAGNNTWHSWKPRAKFVVSVMSNCENKENTAISRAILNELWLNEVMEANVLFLVSNEEEINDLQRNNNDTVYGTYLEIHSWFPYENSEKCHPDEGTVRVNVFTARNFSDIKKGHIFQKKYKRNFHKCPIRVHVHTTPPFVNPPKRVWNKESGYQNVYEDGWEIELLGVVGNALNISLDFQVGKETEYLEGAPAIYVGGYATFSFKKFHLVEPTRTYLTVRLVWYTPCSLKYPRYTHFFKVFSFKLWLSLAFSLVLAGIAVRCISSYGLKSDVHETGSYSNIFCATSNIISVFLSVSVNRQPHSSPLRLFFISWVCFSIAVATVFQAYFTTYLVEPGYVEPIKTLEQMLNYEKEFGFDEWNTIFFSNSSESLDVAILRNAVACPNINTCFKWAAVYQNFSTIINDITMEKFRANGEWSSENNRPLVCALEDGVVRTHGFVFLVMKGRYFIEFINDVIVRVVEGGIFTHMQKQYFYKQRNDSKYNSPTFTDTYTVISISHLQTVFYILLLGYVLAFASFVIEIMWHHWRSKRREPNSTRTYINRHS